MKRIAHAEFHLEIINERGRGFGVVERIVDETAGVLCIGRGEMMDIMLILATEEGLKNLARVLKERDMWNVDIRDPRSGAYLLESTVEYASFA